MAEAASGTKSLVQAQVLLNKGVAVSVCVRRWLKVKFLVILHGMFERAGNRRHVGKCEESGAEAPGQNAGLTLPGGLRPSVRK